MSFIDKLFIVALSLLVITGQCFYQAARIRKGKAINHNAQALWWGAATMWLLLLFPALRCALLLISTRLAFFDFLLNVIRGKPLLYNGDKRASGSLIDRIENHFSDWVILVLKIVYILIWLGLLLFL